MVIKKNNFVVVLLMKMATTLDIITLENSHAIYCLTDDFLQPLDIYPPIEQNDRIKNSIWSNNDWIEQNILNFNDFPIAPLQDKRWEDFPTYSKQRLIKLQPGFNSFSVKNPGTLTFHLKKKNRFEIKNIQKTYTERGWLHLTICTKNHKPDVCENNKLSNITNKNSFLDIEEIVVKNTENTLWKIHNYTFQKAVSVSQRPSVLEIPPTGRSCLILYTILCSECLLSVQVSIDQQKTERKTIKFNNETTRIQQWQQIVINIDSKLKTVLTFERILKKNTSSVIFWGIDLKLCLHTIHGYQKYEVHKENPNSTVKCQSLGTNTVKDKINVKGILCSEPGKLGSNCDISCTNILGPDFPYCEAHKICINSNCLCSWGNHGPFCEKKCDKTKWGPSCQYNCSNYCEKCNAVYGNCMEDNNNEHLIFYLTAMIVIILLLLVVGFTKTRIIFFFNGMENNSDETQNKVTSWQSNIPLIRVR